MCPMSWKAHLLPGSPTRNLGIALNFSLSITFPTYRCCAVFPLLNVSGFGLVSLNTCFLNSNYSHRHPLLNQSPTETDLSLPNAYPPSPQEEFSKRESALKPSTNSQKHTPAWLASPDAYSEFTASSRLHCNVQNSYALLCKHHPVV